MSSLAPINDINLNIFDEICEERFGKIDIDTVLVAIIDNLPTSALPHLAEQYHITGNEGWLHATTEDAKRALIKSAIKIHRYKGTKFALLEIFDSLNLVGEISEWFEYGGDPYHFRAKFDTHSLFEDKLEKELLDLINENKNVRSVLECLVLHLLTEHYLKIASAVITYEEVTV